MDDFDMDEILRVLPLFNADLLNSLLASIAIHLSTRTNTPAGADLSDHDRTFLGAPFRLRCLRRAGLSPTAICLVLRRPSRSPNNMVTHRVVAFYFLFSPSSRGHWARRAQIPDGKKHGRELALADNLVDGDEDAGDTSCT
jgi:hypothetical protein